ncbi:DEAD/DEAH box helicase [Microbacterium sp.]|uniref:DEAD/DEAH box helicase n=1 Tax=Microbacterium sp. TaxID=51671 RepID=UPI003C7067A0
MHDADWRSVLTSRRDEGSVPLALGIELRVRQSREEAVHWGPRRVQTATARSLETAATHDVSVGLRPLVRSDRTGAWIRSDVSWDALRRSAMRHPRDQLRWFTTLFGIAHDTRVLGVVRDDSEWITLDTVESDLLWPHLTAARVLGIPLVATAKNQAVALAPAAEVAIEISRTDAGDLDVAPTVAIAGNRAVAAVVRPIGHSGVYRAEIHGGSGADDIRLTLAPAPLGDALHDLLATGRKLTVPRAETSEFFAQAYPLLAADSAVVAGPGVVLPAPVVTVEAVERSGDHRELLGDPRITVKTVETTDADWFDLAIIVEVDGRRIPFTPLFTALAKREKKLLLADGRYFSLAHPALDRLRDLIAEAGELPEWEAGPRISRYQLALWEDFEDLADQAEPAVAWREAARAFAASRPEKAGAIAPPRGLHAQLRPYQQEGFERLALWWRHGLGGILADDMGLGKTVQVLTLIAYAVESRAEGERRPFLVLAPTSVLATWQEEAARFTPGLRVKVVETTSKRRSAIPGDRDDADIVVTSYTLLRLDEERFTAVEWAGIVLDEAQFVKNPRTRLHQAVLQLRADIVLAVTGTPLENSLTDLWALLSLTCSGLFPSSRKFREEYVKPIEQGKVPENEEGGPYRERRLARLRSHIRPFVLRRTKESVAPELPERQEQVLTVELSPAHRAVYDRVLQRERAKVLGLLEDLDRNRFIVFRSLTLLRLLALAPALVDVGGAHAGAGTAGIRSAKLDALREKLGELVAEGHRALVFSQFTSYLDLVRADFEAHGIRYAYLDGSTRRRGEVVEAFRESDAPVFLISLKAGGFGLTLTEADYVFLLDPWWNPAAEAQAVDRTHRIGQTRPVNVYRLISGGTIEEKVVALQQRKARLFRSVMDDDDTLARSLTADDIRDLLAP